jgi:hypothetical protein
LLRKPITRLAISAAILAALLTWLPISELWSTIRGVSFPAWLAVLLIFVTAHVVTSLKWRLLVNIGKKRLPFSTAVRCHFAGLFANMFLPSLAGGDIVRAGMAMAHSGEKGPVLWGSLLDRFFDTCALALLILFGAMLLPGVLQGGDRLSLLWIAMLLTTVPVGSALILLAPLPDWLPPNGVEFVLRLRDIVKALARHPMVGVAALGIAICIQGGFVLVNAYLGTLCGITLPLAVWCFAWPLAKLIAMLPITFGGIGLREVALAELLGRFGVPASHAVGLGLVWETILLAGGGLGGLFYFIFGKRMSSQAASSGSNKDS